MVKQYRQNGTFQNNERKFYKFEKITRKYTNNQMQEKPNNFGVKYGNQENL